MDKPNCSVVIPIYNGEHTLNDLVARLRSVLEKVASSYEVILVNDGSPDHSWQTIVELSRQHSWVRGINLMRNYGQDNALLCGFRAAQYEVIVTMDDDLQHPPEEIPKLLAKLAEGYDVVYGIPQALPHSWWRNWSSFLTKGSLAYLMGIPTIRDISSFRAFRSHLRRAFDTFQGPAVIVDALFAWGTSRFATATVNERPRLTGRSNYNFAKLVRVAMTIMTGFSTAPLRFASALGFFFTAIGIGAFLYVLGVYFLAGSIPGFPFLASLVSLFSGAQLFALGIIGEYLSRVFDRSTDRPPYVIHETTHQPASRTSKDQQ